MAKSLYVKISTTAKHVDAKRYEVEKAYQIARALRHEAQDFIYANKLGSDPLGNYMLETEIMGFLFQHIVIKELRVRDDITYEISFEEK